MNDQLLRDRLHGAVTDIRPTSRLDEILAGPPGATVPSPLAPRQPPKRITLMAIAAALVLLAAFAAGWLARSAERETTRLENAPATTTAVGSTAASDGPRLGARLTVLASTLPAGVRLVDETLPSPGDGFGATLRLAAEDGTFTGDGPYLRITLSEADGIGTQWAGRSTGEPFVDVDGRNATRATSGPGIEPGWSSLTWASGPDEVIEVQSKGVDDETVLAIARSVRIQP